jgi:predicted acetyltransferase
VSDADHLTMRPITPDEYPAVDALIARVFHRDPLPEASEMERKLIEPDRLLAAFDDGTPVATAGAYTRDLTVPGGPIPAACVTWVSVDPLWTRRGVLTRFMRQQLDGLRTSDGRNGSPGSEAVAVLWASESVIYGRYGYGVASRQASATLRTREAALRADAPVDRSLRAGEPADLVPSMRAVYERVRPDWPGLLSRPGAWWDARVLDPEKQRDGASPLRAAVHDGPDGPDGYVVYQVKPDWGKAAPDGEILVREMLASSALGYGSILAYLLSLDLTRSLTRQLSPLDDPLLHLLAGPRQLLQSASDALWVRLVDLPVALTQRRYAVPIDVVLDVADEFLPHNAGRWRLVAGPDGAECTPAGDRPAHLALSSTELGAAYLGGTSLAGLATAGRVHELVAGSLDPVASAFSSPRSPFCPEIF